jgi:hypothetical protein
MIADIRQLAITIKLASSNNSSFYPTGAGLMLALDLLSLQPQWALLVLTSVSMRILANEYHVLSTQDINISNNIQGM